MSKTVKKSVSKAKVAKISKYQMLREYLTPFIKKEGIYSGRPF